MKKKIENNGFFLIDKPKDWTSHDIVSFVKKKFKLRKVGHAGTLDPSASGLLIVLVNKCTKKFDYFQTLEKEYEAVICLGKETTTYDKEGEIVFLYKGKIDFKEEKILKTLKLFTGKILQKPPIYSALKVKGIPAYKLARRGKSPELKERRVYIKKIDLLKIYLPNIYISIICSSGTYIRSLAYDIGKELKTGAYLTELIRTKIGNLNIKEAKSPNVLVLDDLITDFGE